MDSPRNTYVRVDSPSNTLEWRSKTSIKTYKKKVQMCKKVPNTECYNGGGYIMGRASRTVRKRFERIPGPKLRVNNTQFLNVPHLGLMRLIRIPVRWLVPTMATMCVRSLVHVARRKNRLRPLNEGEGKEGNQLRVREGNYRFLPPFTLKGDMLHHQVRVWLAVTSHLENLPLLSSQVGVST